MVSMFLNRHNRPVVLRCKQVNCCINGQGESTVLQNTGVGLNLVQCQVNVLFFSFYPLLRNTRMRGCYSSLGMYPTRLIRQLSE
jgi:hypothetical protein